MTEAGGDLHLSGGVGASLMGALCIVLVSAHHTSVHMWLWCVVVPTPPTASLVFTNLIAK